MNILILTYQGDMAGSTNSIAYLSKGLASLGHRVVVGCRKESLLFNMLQDSGVILYPMIFPSKTSKASMLQIKEAVERYQIQLINAQSGKDRYLSIFSKQRYRLPVKIIHTRRQTPKSSGGRLQSWFYATFTDGIAVNSDKLKEIFVQKGIPRKHLTVIYNGLPKERFTQFDEEKLASLKKELGIKEGDKVIGCVSRMKNQAQIVKALKYLGKEFKALFVGIEKGSLDQIAAEEGISQQLLYAGKVGGEEVMNYYHLMDLNILASTMDGFGLVLVEAMGMGVPVIGTRHAGIMNVIDDGKNGLWFEDGNIEELANKIKEIVFDSNLRATLIQNGYETAFHKFTIARTVEAYESYFEKIITKDS